MKKKGRRSTDPTKKATRGCQKKQKRKKSECHSGVITRIPFSCARYIGKTGRCEKERLFESVAACPLKCHKMAFSRYIATIADMNVFGKTNGK